MNNNLFFFFNLSVLVCFEVQELKRFAMVPSYKDVWFIPRIHDSLILGYREANGVWIAETEW